MPEVARTKKVQPPSPGSLTRRAFLGASTASVALVAACDGFDLEGLLEELLDDAEQQPNEVGEGELIEGFPTIVPGAPRVGGQIVRSDGNVWRQHEGDELFFDSGSGARSLRVITGDDLDTSTAELITDIDGRIALDVRGLSEGRYDDIVRTQLGDSVLSEVRLRLNELL